MSAVQKVWSSYVYATILLQHGPTAAVKNANADKLLEETEFTPPAARTKSALDPEGAFTTGHMRERANLKTHS
jgi:hypothetical protein